MFICSSVRSSGIYFLSLCFIPNTIIPPLVFANAEKVSQKLSGKPPFADLNSNSQFSDSLIKFLISFSIVFIILIFGLYWLKIFSLKDLEYIISHILNETNVYRVITSAKIIIYFCKIVPLIQKSDF